ncbi:MspA family porin [Nocardia halotolerans]|uniref:MspA family porin n=1 Tax=Nocardia halotolerans TaxID=1755878 RepID=A0ABV8VND3_9NOCA
MRVNLMNSTNPVAAGAVTAARLAGLGCAAVAAIGLLSTGAAAADVFVPLPDGAESTRGASIARTGEHAIVSASMAANGVGRVVWVTADITADVTETRIVEKAGPGTAPSNRPGSDNSYTHGASRINTGYIVGCQVNISDNAVSAGLSANMSANGFGVNASGGLKLGPGDVKFVGVSGKDILKPGHYSVGYRDFEIEIQGCAGYAQARSYTVIEIIGEHHSKATLYGQPFSIG